jgi:hypothetical protein
MEQFMADLSIWCRDSIPFDAAHLLVYNAVTDSPQQSLDDLCDNVRARFEVHLESVFDQPYNRQAIISGIYTDFVDYSRRVYLAWRVAERYLRNLNLRRVLTDIFVSICQNSLQYDDLLNVFTEEFERIQSLELNSVDQSIAISIGQLIQLVFPENVSAFVELLAPIAGHYAAVFADSHANEDGETCLFASLDFFDRQRTFATLLFHDSSYADALCLPVYHSIIIEENALFANLLGHLSDACARRDLPFAAAVYSLVTFLVPPGFVLDRVSEAINRQIVQEKTALLELAASIQWYRSLVTTGCKQDQQLSVNLNRDLVKFVNSDKKALFKDLIHFVSEKAPLDGDLSEIRPVFECVSNKAEFELLYCRQSARRIVTASVKLLEMERKMMVFLKGVSDSYELRGLSELLLEVEKSMELHIGPVIAIPFGLWPFRNAHPQPVALSSFANEISSKYQALFPSRVLRFPIDDWVVHVRNTVSKLMIVGNGVQAEALLFLNENARIEEESLRPQIPGNMLVAALKSLSSAKAPILKSEAGKYSVNTQFKSSARLILPRPVVTDATSGNINSLSVELIDSAIVRIMKGSRILEVNELERQTREAVAGHFSLEHGEFRQRLHHLVTRNYVEVRDNGDVIHIP